MNALRNLVKERLSGKSGGSGGQVVFVFLLFFFVCFFFDILKDLTVWVHVSKLHSAAL